MRTREKKAQQLFSGQAETAEPSVAWTLFARTRIVGGRSGSTSDEVIASSSSSGIFILSFVSPMERTFHTGVLGKTLAAHTQLSRHNINACKDRPAESFSRSKPHSFTGRLDR